ncbi:MAG: DMT family transporter [Segniliparus sp.]|uniref:DMT family transporter n=1 Tax=Segniliparus sp. TaxID=2804064 RepID=UPI003F3DA198
MTAHTDDEAAAAPPETTRPASWKRRLALPPILVAALGPIQWGFNPLVVTELTVPGRFALTALCSTLPVGLVMTAIFRTLPEGVWWWRYLVLSWCNFAISTPLFYYGMQHMPGGIATLLIATQPLFAMLLSLPILGVRPTRAQALAVATGIAGVGLVVFKGHIRLDLVAAGLLLFSAMTAALGLVLTKLWSPPVSAIRHNAWQLLFAGLTLLPVTYLFEGFPSHVTWRNVLGFAIIGFVSKLLGFAVMFRSVPKIGATSVAILTLLTPTTAFVLGFLFKDETLTVQQWLGVALVIGAVVLAGSRGGSRS